MLPTKIVTVDDPVYKKKKSFEAFLLSDVLNFYNLKNQFEPIEFTCSDGYKPVVERDLIQRGKPYLAFRDTEDTNWEEVLVGKSKVNPGPFYLIWPSKIEEANWPYQIISIDQINFKKKYSQIYPQGKIPRKVETGFNLFRKHCLKCHSINLAGGELGPELNIPQNITEYRQKKFLKQFIGDSNSFRRKSPMPPFKDILSIQEIEEIIQYISWMKRFKKNL